MNVRVITAVIALIACASWMTGCHHHHSHSSRRDYEAYQSHKGKAIYTDGYREGYRAAQRTSQPSKTVIVKPQNSSRKPVRVVVPDRRTPPARYRGRN